MQTCALKLCVIFLLVNTSALGLDYSKQQQRYNPNTDFLIHESGNSPNGGDKNQLHSQTFSDPLQQNTANNARRDYVAQFPTLKPPSASNGNGSPNSGLRDYVAPSTQSTQKPFSTSVWTQPPGGKRDYVASQFPTLKPVQGQYVTPKPSTTVTLSTQTTGGKRDYVAPQRSTMKPTQTTNGKVKDLINFFDANSGQSSPQKVPSFSSVLSGSTSKNQLGSVSTTLSVTPTTARPSMKPFSYSNAVSGSKTPSGHTTVTTSKPSTRFPSNTAASTSNSPVLPSSLVNGNRNSQTGNSPTNQELQTLSEELLRKDVNNAAKYITVNYQEKTTSQSKEDKAPSPLLTISPEAWNIPTIQKFVPLLDNYERDTLVNEYVTPQERNEENAFMDAIMSTSVIRHLMNFMKEKGYVTPDPRQQRDFLKQLWFSLYSRGKGKISSSGFEHVFVSEVRNGEVLGLHNWIYFAKEEAANRMNYLGYLKYLVLGDKGVLMKAHFNHQGADKPVNGFFIGTSPELEIALYTLCFVTRPDNDCTLKLANNDVMIVTHTFRYRSKNLIGSAYPQIPSNWN